MLFLPSTRGDYTARGALRLWGFMQKREMCRGCVEISSHRERSSLHLPAARRMPYGLDKLVRDDIESGGNIEQPFILHIGNAATDEATKTTE